MEYNMDTKYVQPITIIPQLDETAVRIAVKVVKQFEGCQLIAYPDPASPLYEALSTHGLLQKYMRGDIKFSSLPENLRELSGTPFTIGYGETKGVSEGDVWTLEAASERLEARVRGFMQEVFKVCPQLVLESPEKVAACTSLAYNIGVSAFSKSTVCKEITAKNCNSAAEAFLMWNKAGGKVVAGLVARRKIESDLFRSV